MLTRKAIVAAGGLACLLAAVAAGCRGPAVTFPAESLAAAAAGAKAAAAFDTNGDGKADVFFFADPTGRFDRIGYDNDGDGQVDTIVTLDAIDVKACRHLVLILDGFGYDAVKECYDAGGLRLFHPPSRVVCPYPTLTDTALEDALGYIPCRAMEARYYDRKAGRVVGGSSDYLTGKNEPYGRLLHYRANTLYDALGYVWPWQVFHKELNDCKRLFDKAATQEVLAYFVSSAGISTADGKAGQLQCLRRVEQLVNQAVTETRGLLKVTLLADHGHSYTPSRQIDFAWHLKKKDWRVTNMLKGPRDVAWIRYGLETYAGFATNSPAQLAADLTEVEGVDLASYAEKDAVVVLAPGSRKAVVRRQADSYTYTPASGDPLKLLPLLGGDAGKGGTVSLGAERGLEATIDHVYPDPLRRLWRAHFGLVENPPDVIVSLADAWFNGSDAFARYVKVASTHGSLNRSNSTTFIMSTAGALPKFMPSADIPANLRRLTGSPFPLGR